MLLSFWDKIGATSLRSLHFTEMEGAMVAAAEAMRPGRFRSGGTPNERIAVNLFRQRVNLTNSNANVATAAMSGQRRCWRKTRTALGFPGN